MVHLEQKPSLVPLLYNLPWLQEKIVEAEKVNKASGCHPKKPKTKQQQQKTRQNKKPCHSITTSLKTGNWKFLASSKPLQTS